MKTKVKHTILHACLWGACSFEKAHKERQAFMKLMSLKWYKVHSLSIHESRALKTLGQSYNFCIIETTTTTKYHHCNKFKFWKTLTLMALSWNNIKSKTVLLGLCLCWGQITAHYSSKEMDIVAIISSFFINYPAIRLGRLIRYHRSNKQCN